MNKLTMLDYVKETPDVLKTTNEQNRIKFFIYNFINQFPPIKMKHSLPMPKICYLRHEPYYLLLLDQVIMLVIVREVLWKK